MFEIDILGLADAGTTLVMGLSLAAACGFRAFLPLLAVNILAATGRVELAESFSFLGSFPATIMFVTATVAEIAGDKIPGFDHFMDAYGVVIKPTAATVTGAAFIGSVEPLTGLALALISAGASASLLGLAKAKVRAVTTVFTGGLGNPVVSTVEDVATVGGVSLIALLPWLSVGAVLFVGSLASVFVVHRLMRRRAPVLATA